MAPDRTNGEQGAIRGGVGEAEPHESAHLHVTGEALYTDDIPLPEGTLHAAIGISERAHARLRRVELSRVRAAPGVVLVLTAEDIPGENNHGPVVHDDPIFAEEVVEYAGQSIFAVVATSTEAARKAARLADIDYEDLEPIMDAKTAVERGSFVMPTRTLTRGQPAARIRAAPHRLQGSLSVGGQEHFYLEGQIGVAVPGEDGTMLIHSSTQHPSEVQKLVAHCLELSAKDVVVMCRRMGGGFGGKETQPALLACIAALGAMKTGKAVKLRLDRDADMLITGKRHPYDLSYEVGFDGEGEIRGIRMTMASNCGRSADLSEAVNVRAMFHGDNCYYLSDVEIVSHRCKTNQPSHTAFRGFGGPQGMMLIEAVIDDIARFLGKDPLDVRQHNFYTQTDRNVTPYGMVVEDNIIEQLVDELARRADYRERRKDVDDIQRAERNAQARPRADAGEVRHFVHVDPPQPGRCADSCLLGRLDPAEPRRHRDGAGAAHQGGAGRRAGIAGRSRAHPLQRHRHQQGAEHLGDRGVIEQRSERQGRAGGGANHQAAPDRVRRGEVRRRRNRTWCSQAGRCASAARRRSRSPSSSGRRISRACRCRQRASTRRPRSTTT